MVPDDAVVHLGGLGFVNIGMWMERFVIVVTSLHNDFMPGNWATTHRVGST